MSKGLPQDSLGFLVADLARRMRGAFALHLEGSGLTLAQARALLYVARHEGMRQVELSKLLEVQPITLARLIDQLQQSGLVERRADPKDGRAYRIFLTSASGPHLATIERVASVIRKQSLQGIGQAEARRSSRPRCTGCARTWRPPERPHCRHLTQSGLPHERFPAHRTLSHTCSCSFAAPADPDQAGRPAPGRPPVRVAGCRLVYLRGGRYVETDNAYVKADKVPISAEVSGTIKEVLVDENQPVTAGQVLFRIDPAPFKVAVARAEAKLAQVRTDLAAMRASYRAMQAEITVARTKLSFAQKDQQRQADLVARNFVSASRFDDARQTTDLASQQITAMEQDLSRIAATLGGGVDVPVERHPSYRSAQAELEQAQLDLARVEVRAAVPGVAIKPPKPGQYVAAGSTAMALVASGNLWIEANFTETDLTYVRVGQPVAIHIDTYPNQAWKGVVDSLSPATGAEFSVIPAQNATGNWVKIAQRVAVRIKIDPGSDLSQLRTGLSTTVEVDTGHRRRLLGMSL